MKSVYLLLSGGIDSTICSFILKKIGYIVFCICFKNTLYKFDCNLNYFIKNLFYISEKFDLFFNIFNVNKIYSKFVTKKLINSYKNGDSFNPDIICNKYVKFGLYFKKHINNFDYYSSGHYSKIISYIDNFFIKDSIDFYKNQTYFLCNINTKILNKLFFPIGSFYKHEVKFLCKYLNLPNYKDKSSKGICLFDIVKFSNFISKYCSSIGNILYKNNKIISKYSNLYYLSLGQRLNLNLNRKFKSYIYNKLNGNIYITNKQNNLLFKRIFRLKNLNLMPNLFKSNFVLLNSKSNSRSKKLKCFIVNKSVVFIYPIYLLSKGQFIVFYYDSLCLGGFIVN
ncbi:MAG: aminomethyltransferase beta-barrel domain-containing protein [Candidatus Vidania fulgoroideorum]